MRFLLGHSMPLSCQCDISFPPSREEGSLRSLARSPPSTHLSSFGSLHNVSSRVSSEEHAVTVVIRANFPVVSLRFSEMYVASKYVAHNYERTMDGRTDFVCTDGLWVGVFAGGHFSVFPHLSIQRATSAQEDRI